MLEWLRLAAQRAVVLRALKVATVVGTILVAINHGNALLRGEVDAERVWRILLTVCVPYCVATYSSVATQLDARRRAPGQEDRG